jgi:hypothetical protein
MYGSEQIRQRKRTVKHEMTGRMALLTVALACAAGCTTKTAARKQSDAAFHAGQQQALQQLYEKKFPTVTIIGPVRSPKLDWTTDLTLARAIVAAGYQGLGDPKEIILRRGNEEARITPKELLSGDDWELQPGDRIEIVP